MLVKGDLYRSGKLRAVAYKKDIVQMNPNDGAELNLIMYNYNKNFYTEQAAFFKASTECENLLIELPNEVPLGQVFMPKKMYDKLSRPNEVQVFLKGENAYVQRVEEE